MSKPGQPVGGRVDRPAERTLFRALFDDAAVFQPGFVPLPQAIADHVARASSPYADLVGPLLLPASAIEDFLHLERPSRVEVVLVGRPGTDLTLVAEALSRLQEGLGVTVTGVEIGWSPEWEQTLGWNASLLSVEVPRGPGQEHALSELQPYAAGPGLVQAKFRTGATPDAPEPTPTELASFIRAAVDHDLGFKLTGGLHHAISQSTAEGRSQTGFLNVIAATRYALAHGAEVPEMETILCQRDPAPILDITTRMSGADASVLRAFFTAYGCCGVMDPIGDLASLGLIKETTV